MRSIYMVQPNSIYGNSVYFPYAAGCLIAYAFNTEEIRNEYRFESFFYKKEDIDTAVKSLQDPFLIGFSCYVWNYEYNKAFAQAVKKMFPQCITVFGGHQVNENSEIARADYVDYILQGEGEESFRLLLMALCGKEEIANVPNLIYRDTNGQKVVNKKIAVFANRVSPYLSGLFDPLIEKEELEFSAVLETNRGCPNRCAFCDWGNIKSKMKIFDTALVKAEIDWMAEHKIEYCYSSDSNFGLFERDMDIVEYVVQKNRETGYPQKFQATYSKNNPETVFAINKKLNAAGMSKGATLSFQSMSREALSCINRQNMPLENFLQLMNLYNSHGIATYSELILGLPGETYCSFKEGIEQLLECGQHMAINFFNCELLTNSIMSDPAYIEKYKIEYAVTEQHQYHVVPNRQGIPEYSKIVVSTSTLSREDWIACNILHVFVRTFHNLGLLQCIAIYLHHEKKIRYTDFYCDLIAWAKNNPASICGRIRTWLESKYKEILQNEGSLTCYDPDFGELTWPLEEGSFLKIIREYNLFYSEIVDFLQLYFDDNALLQDLLQYQKAVVKTPHTAFTRLQADYDFFAYFTDIYKGEYKPLQQKKTSLQFDARDVPQTLPEYGVKVIWFGRKGGQNIIKDITYIDNSSED
ncbi:MAG: hypothetical protein E7523_06430 [Ruminococcaceae bacterium]|nr:hypothetical protein [Oscillospiraceae bacterium]